MRRSADAYVRSRRRIRLRGEEPLSDLPRPDRLGLVMKYLWALKGSSPAAAFMRFEVPSDKSFQLCSLSLKFATMRRHKKCWRFGCRRCIYYEYIREVGHAESQVVQQWREPGGPTPG